MDAQTLDGVFDGLPVELSMERTISPSLSTARALRGSPDVALGLLGLLDL